MKIHIKLTKTKKILASSLLVLFALVTVFGTVITPRIATADNLDSQIAALQRENDANRNHVAQLQNEALSYQDAISRLQSQISILQGQIDDNTAKQNELQAKIDEGQRELDKQRAVLGENIRAMYVEGQISTLEILATSKNLSDFVDKEEYRTAIKNKIQDTLKQINKLQNELKEQKTQVEKLLEEQRGQRAELDAGRREQAKLLTFNKAQQADYNNRTKSNQARIAQLIAEQRRAIDDSVHYYFLRFPGAVQPHNPGVNDYPYAGSGFSMSTAPGCNDGDGPDRWGYCTRQCVSYAAWAVERSGRSAPRYYGNAKNWVSKAWASGVSVYTTDPQPGDVAISTAGTWGHAMYVEQVSGNRIFVSEYNKRLDGQYFTEWRTFD